jgi:predicted transposase YbfD/YdcC
VRYPLVVILVLSVLAKLAGEDEVTGMAEWARWRTAWLVPALQLKHPRLPHRTTYSRILGQAVPPGELERRTSDFLQQLPQDGVAVVINLDGKTVRGTIPRGQSHGLHLLAAYLPEHGIVLLQVVVETKENEIPASVRVVQLLDLQGKIVTGDALLTQRELSAAIVDAGGEYVWTVKENQPQLLADIEAVFAATPLAKGHSLGATDFRSATTVDKGHGRFEKRTLTTSSWLVGYSDWPGLAQVFKLERTVTDLVTGQTHPALVYGITSLTPDEADPKRLLSLVRRHWSIENGLHYRRDRTLREDACRLKTGHAPQVMTLLNNLVLGLLVGQGVRNVPQARRYLSAHLDHAVRLLLCRPA